MNGFRWIDGWMDGYSVIYVHVASLFCYICTNICIQPSCSGFDYDFYSATLIL